MLALDVDDTRVQIMNVHLKSGCVSAIGGAGEAKHIGISRFGGNKHPNVGNPEPLLAIADPCPMIATVTLQ